MKSLLCMALCLLLCTVGITQSRAHPDGATPFWYSSAWIFGFVEGCASKIEESQMEWVSDFWPDDVRAICGCTVDALRHGFTFHEVEADSERVQTMVNTTLPICIDEQRRVKSESI